KDKDHHEENAGIEAADRIAEGGDRDEILVDLKDDTRPDQVAALDREFGIDLKLVDDTAKETELYRAHVDPAQRDAILAGLAKEPAVEIAEPDSEMSLSPIENSGTVEEPLLPTHEGFPNDPLYPKQWHMRQIGMPEAWK